MPDSSEETTPNAISSLGSTKTKCLSEKHTKARLDDGSFRMLKQHFCMTAPVISIQTYKIKLHHNLQIYYIKLHVQCFSVQQCTNKTKISEVTKQFGSQYTFKIYIIVVRT